MAYYLLALCIAGSGLGAVTAHAAGPVVHYESQPETAGVMTEAVVSELKTFLASALSKRTEVTEISFAVPLNFSMDAKIQSYFKNDNSSELILIIPMSRLSAGNSKEVLAYLVLKAYHEAKGRHLSETEQVENTIHDLIGDGLFSPYPVVNFFADLSKWGALDEQTRSSYLAHSRLIGAKAS
jgi:hypothetical protein